MLKQKIVDKNSADPRQLADQQPVVRETDYVIAHKMNALLAQLARTPPQPAPRLPPALALVPIGTASAPNSSGLIGAVRGQLIVVVVLGLFY